jgi:hypothetical protein
VYTFDPALQAEISYRREDVRSSFRSSRRFRTRAQAAPADASTGTRSHLPLGGHGTVAHRAA